MLMKTLRCNISYKGFLQVCQMICFFVILMMLHQSTFPSLVPDWWLEHTWDAFVQRNKQTWVMLENHLTLDNDLYCFTHLILYFCISCKCCCLDSCHCGQHVWDCFVFFPCFSKSICYCLSFLMPDFVGLVYSVWYSWDNIATLFSLIFK